MHDRKADRHDINMCLNGNVLSWLAVLTSNSNLEGLF